jgi:hypothetical protein
VPYKDPEKRREYKARWFQDHKKDMERRSRDCKRAARVRKNQMRGPGLLIFTLAESDSPATARCPGCGRMVPANWKEIEAHVFYHDREECGRFDAALRRWQGLAMPRLFPQDCIQPAIESPAA